MGSCGYSQSRSLRCAATVVLSAATSSAVVRKGIAWGAPVWARCPIGRIYAAGDSVPDLDNDGTCDGENHKGDEDEEDGVKHVVR